ncbi:hypothetical protein BDM02DRAFT_497652 [Thelephora ganbajun]|uniref:Uncharacterized protein n=1 Tax=Thelephora ganbajun TaxID=370292 RepID=A0ACB6Z8P8_THEGA|nr:hypothetical protein BDM02DRAFT_497652 [Thelephora ganbajun]
MVTSFSTALPHSAYSSPPPPSFPSEYTNHTRAARVPLPSISPRYPFIMRRSSSALVRRTHSSSISRQAQVLPTTSTIQPPPSPRVRTPSTPTPDSPGTERVKEWIDIFDGPMRPAVFVPSPSSPSPSSTPIRDNDSRVSSIIFDGPARPRYIIPGAYIRPPAISAQNQNRDETGPLSTTSRKDSSKVSVSGSDISALLSRSSLPPPQIYDGPAFEWELRTKRV